MLTDKEKEWLRMRAFQKHSCENCWWHEARKYQSYLDYVNGSLTRGDKCEICSLSPKPDKDHAIDDYWWSNIAWYCWDDGTHTECSMTSDGFQAFHTAEKLDKRWYEALCGTKALEDSAEFESRVSAKLVKTFETVYRMGKYSHYYASPDPSHELKLARLAVEEEMDHVD